ncbi:PREDICTED: O-glucosyltransferase rumi homolog [Tarenaya hassleriana]|uniref:O-glucosyltransferase rumi homolog n=1 Tax=Tarenaya hassleriana TaxID=28532 RepID=UPI00053C67AF|nr:PREDICTED: O-glucosyltransferase rumi homolog [Tarenaya hassleriana]
MGESGHGNYHVVQSPLGTPKQNTAFQNITSRLARTWITTTIFIFFLLGASLCWMDMVVVREGRIQLVPLATRNNTNSPRTEVKIPLSCSANQTIPQACPSNYPTKWELSDLSATETEPCPDYFRWIHRDLDAWRKEGITRETLERARPKAHFRLVIKGGKVYVEQYDKAFQTRDVFTIWGIVQLLRLYPGGVPDLELLFMCHDRPAIWKRDYQGVNATLPPPPLFHYCGHRDAFDIVFPDWSFWGWPEVNIKAWNKLSEGIAEGNKRVKWKDRVPYAYWKGNPGVSSLRAELMRCNFSDKYDPMVHLYAQDWVKEIAQGFKDSNLEDQCTHRYKIYIEGVAWSVSEKYILACDSMTLLVKPEYHDFFSRSMVPMQHYWPIRPYSKCRDIKFAVEWGNSNTDKAEAIGRKGSGFIQKNLEMKYVYDYMLHLLQDYAKLLKMEVKVPEGAKEVCSETMACPTDEGPVRKCMDDSMVTSPSDKVACSMPPPYKESELERFLARKVSAERKVEKWVNEYWERQNKLRQR